MNRIASNTDVMTCILSRTGLYLGRLRLLRDPNGFSKLVAVWATAGFGLPTAQAPGAFLKPLTATKITPKSPVSISCQRNSARGSKLPWGAREPACPRPQLAPD